MFSVPLQDVGPCSHEDGISPPPPIWAAAWHQKSHFLTQPNFCRLFLSETVETGKSILPGTPNEGRGGGEVHWLN